MPIIEVESLIDGKMLVNTRYIDYVSSERAVVASDDENKVGKKITKIHIHGYEKGVYVLDTYEEIKTKCMEAQKNERN